MKIVSPNTTDLPNDLVDHWLPLLKEGELKVLLVIIRKTFGWHKQRDRLSLSQLEKITGLSRRSIIDSVNSLIQKGLIQKETIGNLGSEQTYYWLVIDDTEECKNYTPPSVDHTPPPVQNLHPQKKSLKSLSKDKEREASPSPSKILNKHGQFVSLTIEEYDKLCLDHTKKKIDDFIDRMNDHCAAKGTKYKDYAAALRNWIRNEKEMPKKPLNDFKEQIMAKFKNGETYNGAICSIDSVGIGFDRGMTHKEVKWNENGLKEQILNMLRSFGIQFEI